MGFKRLEYTISLFRLLRSRKGNSYPITIRKLKFKKLLHAGFTPIGLYQQTDYLHMAPSETAAIIQQPFYFSRWTASILIFVLILVGHATGISSETKGAQNRLEVCIASRIVSLDPASYRDRTTQAVLKNIFDGLTTRDAGMRVAPPTNTTSSMSLMPSLASSKAARKGGSSRRVS